MKTRTVGALNARHIGREVVIGGVVYRVRHIDHHRSRTRLYVEWDDPDDATVYRHGDRDWPHRERCRVTDAAPFHRPTLKDKLLACRHFDQVVEPGPESVGRTERRGEYLDRVTYDPAVMEQIRAWDRQTRQP